MAKWGRVWAKFDRNLIDLIYFSRESCCESCDTVFTRIVLCPLNNTSVTVRLDAREEKQCLEQLITTMQGFDYHYLRTSTLLPLYIESKPLHHGPLAATPPTPESSLLQVLSSQLINEAGCSQLMKKLARGVLTKA